MVMATPTHGNGHTHSLHGGDEGEGGRSGGTGNLQQATRNRASAILNNGMYIRAHKQMHSLE